MNIQQYLTQREQRRAQEVQFRNICKACMQPDSWCYCKLLEPFDCKMEFVILLHPLEKRRRIASGRMSHLMLKHSHIILGHNYSDDPNVNEVIADPKYYPVILHLDQNSIHLNSLSEDGKKTLCPPNKKLLIFVVDGTWNTASKTVRLSKNLNALPRISFTPNKPSRFRVRQQPKPMCFSTLEAIHQTIELLGDSQGFDTKRGEHHKLLKVFDSFVAIQADYLQALKDKTGTLHYRKRQRPSFTGISA